MTLADIIRLQRQKEGSHSLQESWGCEMQKNNPTRGFWDFYYDEEPFLSFHPVTHSWTVHPSSAQTLAMKVKKHWKSDDSPSKAQWAHVQGTICGRLQRYLNSWIAFNKTIVSPIVTVTCGEALEDTINATCWAFGFYPWIISLTWLQDGEPLNQDTQQSGSLLPYGNGTYQTCVSTRIPQGQEQRFSCHVRHSGKESTGTVPCGGRQFQLQRVQLRSSQVLNHQQMVKRNHNSTLQLASSFQGDAVEHICPEELEP
ncbi:MHC class I polypeptide-related sequence A-like [Marmota monax]|uniref:MHC class I polypeptide-related sequence A-like n=1 Tax=Marmota monax TaxID=9995 RepID=UPI001EAFFD86|nr:MHC class I polypeptide-related sequence A-like [Marmota monax]